MRLVWIALALTDRGPFMTHASFWNSCIFNLTPSPPLSSPPRHSCITLRVSLSEDRRALVATVHQHLFLFYFFLKSHHETRRPRWESLRTLLSQVVWIRRVAKKHSARRQRYFFELLIKVFEVEQRRRRRCVVPFRGHREVVFPRGCACASLQSRAGFRNEPEKPLLCLQLLCPCGTKVRNFAAAITNGWVLPSIFSLPHSEFKVSNGRQG